MKSIISTIVNYVGELLRGTETKKKVVDRAALHPKIKKEAGKLIALLAESGWVVHSSQYSAKFFGNWLILLRRGDDQIRLVKDRSEYSLDLSGSELEASTSLAGGSSYTSFSAFQEAICRWLDIFAI